MSRPIVNRKNCLGDAATVYNTENDLNYFSSQIFPEASIHLPGEREVLMLNYLGTDAVDIAKNEAT